VDHDQDDDARELVPLARALRHLLLATMGMRPEDLPHEVAAAAACLGARDVVLLLADLDQERLVRFGGDPTGAMGDEPVDGYAVDGDGPGRAFREETVVEEPCGDGDRRAWVAVMDSAERLGVLGLVDDGTVARESWLALASLVGELVVSKSVYGDAIVLRRRRRPFSLAAEMRWALLPPLTFTAPDVEISGVLHPSHSVAGDAFDYALDGGRMWLAIVDAMGHGTEASQMANAAVATFRNERRAGAVPAGCLRALDRVITERFGDLRYVTAQVAELDLATGWLDIANCGHEPPLLLRSGRRCEPIDCPPALPAGLGSTPSSTRIRLDAGDAVLLYSDGVIEARSPERELFGEERLGELMTGLVASDLPTAEILRLATRAVVDHQRGIEGDDATMVLLRRPAGGAADQAVAATDVAQR
jgi:hypothetical protein